MKKRAIVTNYSLGRGETLRHVVIPAQEYWALMTPMWLRECEESLQEVVAYLDATGRGAGVPKELRAQAQPLGDGEA